MSVKWILAATLIAMGLAPVTALADDPGVPAPTGQASSQYVPGKVYPGIPSGGYPGAPSPNLPGAGESGGMTPGDPGAAAPGFSTGAGAGDAAGGAGADGAGLGGSDTGFAPGLGGTLSAAAAPPGVIGDMSPIRRIQAARFPDLPGQNPPPVVRPGGGGGGNGNQFPGSSVLVYFTSLKIADNQSPRPQDRFFFSFNYFDDVNKSLNERVGSPVSNLRIFHYLLGFEKTFLDRNASIGVRLPINVLTLNSTVKGLPHNSSALGNLSVFGKYILAQNDNGDLFSVGLNLNLPTGPKAFAGNNFYTNLNTTDIQPFVGFIKYYGDLYFQGFSSINVPLDRRGATLWFNDLAVGYFLKRSLPEEDEFISAIAPTFEAHLTTPLNHRGFDINDVASTADTLDLTFGLNTEIRNRSIVTVGYATPVTGPRPFSGELIVQLNVRFGAARYRAPTALPFVN